MPDKSAIGTEDLEHGLSPTPLRRLPAIAAMAIIALLLFNSQGLVGWTQRLPSTAKNEWIAHRASDWHEAMQWLGLAQPMAGLRIWLQQQAGRPQ